VKVMIATVGVILRDAVRQTTRSDRPGRTQSKGRTNGASVNGSLNGTANGHAVDATAPLSVERRSARRRGGRWSPDRSPELDG
jgi:hypothetical protein